MKGEETADSMLLEMLVSDNGDPLPFAAESTPSRGLPTTLAELESFKLFGHAFSGKWDETARDEYIPDYIYNLDVTKTSGWTIPYYWPVGRKLKMYAYSPDRSVSSSRWSGIMERPSKTAKGEPTITYRVPDRVENQLDLLVANAEGPGENISDAVEMNFTHALTSVRFVVDKNMPKRKIVSVSIQNVCCEGKYNMDSETWELSRNKNGELITQSFSKSLDVPVGEDSEKDVYTPEEFTFMMIPQTLPERASVSVTFWDENPNEEGMKGYYCTYSGYISGKTWEKNKVVTYRVTPRIIELMPVLDVRYTNPTVMNCFGTSMTFNVISYGWKRKEDTNLYKQQVAWKAEFVEPVEGSPGEYSVIEKPEWIESYISEGPGMRVEDTNYNLGDQAVIKGTIETPATGQNPHQQRLLDATPVVNYDLSTRGGTTPVNAANCYICNAAGSYKLPLIYGNAIEGGVDNKKAYTSSKTGEHYLTNFVNHLDLPITDPYIYNNKDAEGNNLQPEDAILVWQDSKYLIKDVKLTDDKHYLSFTVNRGETADNLGGTATKSDALEEGNAVVAVRDKDGKIMWSWHIWVTDFVPLAPLGPADEMYDASAVQRDKVVRPARDAEGNLTDERYTFMGRNIGLCFGKMREYKGYRAYIRFRQIDEDGREIGEPVIREVVKIPFSVPESYKYVGFSFGRKDPITCKIRYKENDEEIVYDSTDPLTYKVLAKSVTIGEAIQAPQILFGEAYDTKARAMDWRKTVYWNLWNTDADVPGSIESDSKKYEKQVDNMAYPFSDVEIVKTIYDPSPYGYHLPNCRPFFTFAHTVSLNPGSQNYISNVSNVNEGSSGISNNELKYFLQYCHYLKGKNEFDPTGGTLSFAHIPQIYISSNSLTNNNPCASYYTAIHNDYEHQGVMFWYNGGTQSKFFSTASSNSKNYGAATACSVLPVREKWAENNQ